MRQILVFLVFFILIIEKTHQSPNLQISYFKQSFVNIFNDNLRDCSTFFLQDYQNEDPTSFLSDGDFDIFKDLSESTIIDLFLLNINRTGANEIDQLIAPFGRIRDFRKARPYCTVTVVMISQLNTGGMELYQIIKKLNGVIKKDNDYFIFVTKPDIIDEVLLSKPLASGIKYRIGITTDGASGIIAKSSCFYCMNGPSVIQVNLNSPTDQLFRNQIKNLEGTALRVSTPTSTRWLNEMTHSPDGKWHPRRGPYALALKLLEKQLNFTSFHFPSTGGGTGGVVNGTWVGTVGDILYGRADMGHVTAETWSRNKVVAHSFPISNEFLTFSTGIPQRYFTWMAIFRPLAPSVWPFVGVSVVVGFVSFIILLKKDLHGRKSVSFHMVADYVLGTILEQDAKSPDEEVLGTGLQASHSLRVFTIFWLMYTLLITTAYRSKLVTFLAFPNIREPPSTFEELAVSSYAIGLQYIKGAAYQVIKNSKNPTYSRIYKRMSLEESDVECFLRASNPEFSCISWDSIAEFVKHRNLTDKYGQSPVQKSSASTLAINAGIITEKRSVFKNEMDHILVWITDTGILKKLYLLDFQWIREQRTLWLHSTNQTRPEYSKPTGSANVLSRSHLSGSFYILLLGFVISILCFVIEKVWNIFSARLKRKEDVVLIMLKDLNF